MIPEHGALHPPSTTPTLKRPRPEPPSPSSSSPKRAASEDPGSSSSEAPQPHTTQSQLSQLSTTAGSALPSSPLRMDVDDEHEHESVGWVTRTGQVTLSEDGADDVTPYPVPARPSTREVLDALIGAFPPPYTAYAAYYLLPKPFFTAFQNHAHLDVAGTPPPLDLSPLTDPASGTDVWSVVPGRGCHQTRLWRLREGLVEDEDFIYLAADGWDTLTRWYSYPDPDTEPVLCRLGLPGERIEIAPLTFKLHIVSSNPSIPVPPAMPPAPILFTAPTTTTAKHLREGVRKILGDRVPLGSPLRIWAVGSSDPISALELDVKELPRLSAKLFTGNTSIADEGIVDGDSLVVELSTGNSGGTPQFAAKVDTSGKAMATPLFSKPAFYSGSGAPSSSSNSLLSINKRPETRSMVRGRGGRGLVGLTNLGNTCFLASATQCLSNTHVLIDYFLTGVYREELNRDNPLGMYGQVAEAFGETIESLWSNPAHSSYAPRRLKSTCSRFAPQFAGYGQHDTQEFLAFLLDGLHEDLNRIKKKPYIEKPDWKPGGGDRELAQLGKDCWEGYKQRNDSVIVDLFQGQLQSTLVCPECHKESITMDPFMYLTVPLPIAQTRTFKLVFFPRDVNKPPVTVQLLVPVNASFAALKDKLGALVKAPSSNIVGFDLWKGGVYAWWLDSEPNSEAKDHDVCVFHELGAPVTANHKAVGTVPTDGSVTVPVYTYTTWDSPRSSFHHRDTAPSECSLEPFFITLSPTEAANPTAVREAIALGYSRLCQPEMRSALWVPANSEHAKVAVDDDDNDQQITEEEGEAKERKSTDGLAPPPSTIPRNGSSTSLASQSSRLVPCADMFKVHVADASSADSNSHNSMGFLKSKDPNVQSLYRGNPNGAAGAWSSLEKRARARRPMFQRISSSISNLVGSAANSDDEGETDVASPCVRPGEAIFVEWSSEHFNEFFEPDRKSLMNGLEHVIDPAIEKEAAKKRAGREISLEDCLDEFSKEETLGQDDLWYCPVCKKHQAATKKLDIYKAPDILVICIKRFGSSRALRDKLDNMVNFPIENLDLDERIGERRVTKSLNLSDDEARHYGIEHSTEPFIYDLYAVDNHFGGLGGGHYTAFCQNKEDGQWYNYDDSRVSKTTAESVQTRAAYLLFYKRRTARPIGGISRIKAEEASRAATPMASEPASPVIGPSVPASANMSSMPSMPDTPVETSPMVSDDDSSFGSARGDAGDADDLPGPSDTPATPATPATDAFASSAASIGYGNTAWGRPAATTGVRHTFAENSLPTPDSSDSEVVIAAPSTGQTTSLSASAVSASGVSGSTRSGEVGLGEEYHVVRSDDTSDAEMVSAPRSPPSTTSDAELVG